MLQTLRTRRTCGRCHMLWAHWVGVQYHVWPWSCDFGQDCEDCGMCGQQMLQENGQRVSADSGPLQWVGGVHSDRETQGQGWDSELHWHHVGSCGQIWRSRRWWYDWKSCQSSCCVSHAPIAELPQLLRPMLLAWVALPPYAVFACPRRRTSCLLWWAFSALGLNTSSADAATRHHSQSLDYPVFASSTSRPPRNQRVSSLPGSATVSVDRTLATQAAFTGSPPAVSVKPRIEESREDSMEVTSRMDDDNTPVGGPLGSCKTPIGGCSAVDEAKIRGSVSSPGPDVWACRWVGSAHQCDVVDFQVAGRGFGEWQSGRTFLQKQIWRYSCWHGFWAQTRCRGCVRRSRESRRHESNSLWQQESKRLRRAGTRQWDKRLLRAAQVRLLLRATRMWLRRTRWVERSQCRWLVLQCVKHCAVWSWRWRGMQTEWTRSSTRISWSNVWDAGELFFHEDLWDRWSLGLSFAMKMSKGPDARESQLCGCSEDGQARDHVKNVVMNVSCGLNREIDSLKAIGSYDVGGVGEESNVMKPDENTKKVHCVVCRISSVGFDPRLLRESEIDVVNLLGVYRKRPRQWALSSPVIPTRRVDERYLTLCEREFGWSSSVVKCVTFNVMS